MSVANVKVSERGEIVLPAESLRRWGLGSGGEVEIADLGDALLVVPAERGGLRSMVRVAVDDAGGYAVLSAKVGDEDLDLA